MVSPAVVPVTAPVTADETEALKAEITKAVKQVQEAGEMFAIRAYFRLGEAGAKSTMTLSVCSFKCFSNISLAKGGQHL